MSGISTFKVGDTIKVFQKVKEGKKERSVPFRGVVLNIKGTGVNAMFTVRQTLEGIDVDKIFPFDSPTVEKIDFVEKPKKRVKRSNLVNSKVS